MTSGMRRVHACVCGSASFVVSAAKIDPRIKVITGDQAHSREFSEQAYQLAAEPKQLVVDTLATFFQNGVSARQ
ncbi:hypothetical protein D8S82_15430 [Mycobacterium hodleri]|uniref:Uncharacterized protein n=1 Tax=Mycolicibacterium hodleri TaxID=49897 RepID=A0A544W0H6_9MYCO|nr:hypothetical protein [Mycolicibacterium hodleri]TQR85723.1 hypothetical protein D8S82_15430 [Mycolicibacterium hodleri]